MLVWTGLILNMLGTVADAGHGNKSLGSVNVGKFLGSWPLKDSISCSSLVS